MLNNEFPPLGGGTATVNAEILDCFRENPELEIDLITSALGDVEEEQLLAKNVRILKVPVENDCIHHSSNKELSKYAWRAYHLAARLHKTKPYNLCLAWSAVPAGAVALALNYTQKLPYFIRVCGPDIPGFEARYKWLYPFLGPLIKKVWNRAEGVIAKCDSEAELIRQVDSSITPRVIRNGVNLQKFSGDKSEERDVPRIVCVGRLIERKGQETLLRACGGLKQKGIPFALSLVGTGDSEERYRELASTLSIANDVEFRGVVSRKDMPAEYARSDIFVLPSENEGMSVATLEALATGLPLLLTPTPGTELLLEVGKNGFTFPIADTAALESLLEKLLQSEEKRDALSNGSLEIAKNYSWNEVAEEYRSLFKEHTSNGS